MNRLTAIPMALAALALPATGRAQTVSAANVQSVVAALQSAGYRAEIDKDETGDPMIKSTSSGTNFAIYFYGCTNNTACTTVQFFAGYVNPARGTLAEINKWNTEGRFARAYLTDRGAARIEMDLDLDDGGMSRALFVDNLEFWVSVMARFEKQVVNR